MSANALLRWMSARGSGSWPQFRGAVEELHINSIDPSSDLELEETALKELPLYQHLRLNLQRLGHVEFYSGHEAGWRVSPPTIAGSDIDNGSGVLVGARSDTLLTRLREAAGGDLNVIQLEVAPDAILILGKAPGSLEKIAGQAGIAFQDKASVGILLVLPRVDDFSVLRQVELPFGDEWKVDRFSTSAISWVSSSLAEAQRARGGCFRFVLRYRREFYFCRKGKYFRVSNQLGKYLALSFRRRRVLSYDSRQQRISVPVGCRPPFLVERALVLASGSLPTLESGNLSYNRISQLVATLTAGVLKQEGL